MTISRFVAEFSDYFMSLHYRPATMVEQAGYNGRMAPRKSSRRSFLQGRSAVEALADAVPSVEMEASAGRFASAASDSQTYLLRIGRRAMACEFEVLLNAGQYSDGAETAVAALDLVEQLEDQMTVFRSHSEVSRLNRLAVEQEVEVEPRLYELLAFAKELHRRTDGAYDITSGPLSKVWGFFRRAGAMPQAEDLAAAIARIGSQNLELNESRRTVRFMKPEMEINLGSIGKGYALDRCAELLESRGVADFVVHGGQSSVLARGGRGHSGGEGWSIGLRNPLRPAEQLGEIRLRNRALGTSGSGTQFFYHRGRRHGHILDPRNGRPAEGMLSTTVLAPSGAEADALSTAFFVMGMDASLAYCESHASLGAILIAEGSKTGSLDIRIVGLDKADWKPR
jgi:thiamine biosynthesis lipoprotein